MLFKLVRHIFNGTLFARLCFEWRKFIFGRWDKTKIFTYKLSAGLRLYHYPSQEELTQRIFVNEFELHERMFLEKLLRPGDVFVDLGAHHGLLTLTAAKRVGITGLVYAVEPCAEVFEKLKKNIELNNFTNIKTYQCAIADRTGSAEIQYCKDGTDFYSSLTITDPTKRFTASPVPVWKWSDFIKNYSIRDDITLLKMDVEGWEANIIEASKDWFLRDSAPALQIEFSDFAALANGKSTGSLYRMILDCDYDLYRYNAERNFLSLECAGKQYPYTNLYAFKKKSSFYQRLKRLIKIRNE